MFIQSLRTQYLTVLGHCLGASSMYYDLNHHNFHIIPVTIEAIVCREYSFHKLRPQTIKVNSTELPISSLRISQVPFNTSTTTPLNHAPSINMKNALLRTLDSTSSLPLKTPTDTAVQKSTS